MDIREYTILLLQKLILPINKQCTDHTCECIEYSIYKKAKKYVTENNIPIEDPIFTNTYNNIFKYVCENLDPESHIAPDYIKNLHTISEQDLKYLAFNKPYEFNIGNWTEIIDEKKLKELSILKLKSGSKQTRCRKCKGYNIDVVSAQTRSADEGMTTIMTCKDCGHVKKG